MYKGERCSNMNHSRTNAPVRFCPTCGDMVNKLSKRGCSETLHAQRRKDRNHFCNDCGIALR